MKNKRKSGGAAEQYAANYLISKNWKIINQNYFCTVGEIDIIAYDKDKLVFVEVRSIKQQPKNERTVYELVTPQKLKQIKRTVDFWIMENDFKSSYRVDYIGLEQLPNGEYNLQHFSNL